MILILGAKGMLGGALVKVFGEKAVAWDREDCDVTEFANLKSKISDLKPEAIINCVGFNDVDGAESNRDLAFKLNAEVVEQLALLCAASNIMLVHISSNYVFDGEKGEYEENDRPAPLSVYGQSKYAGEQAIASTAKKYYLIRTSVLFGAPGRGVQTKPSFVQLILEKAKKSDSIKAVSDEVNSLTFVEDLAGAIKSLLEAKAPFGIYHITNSGQTSWYDFAKEIFAILGKEINLLPVPSSEFVRAAKRPKKSVLLNTKLGQLRPWQEALSEFLKSDTFQ